MDLKKYLEKSIRESGLEIEYDSFLKNIHPSHTLIVKCLIDDNSMGFVRTVILAPLEKKLVMSHSCGPTLFNEYGFEILEISIKNKA